MMNLVTILGAMGSHYGSWRHPFSFRNTVENLDQQIYMARLAERGCFDAIFLADGNAVRDMEDKTAFESPGPSARAAGFEPVTLLSAISMVTKHIGLVATATTTYDEPYHVARRFASLDHLSEGRAGWNIVTTSYDGDSRNFGLVDHIPKDIRYERAGEFVDVVTKLWDSWAPDAFIQDRMAGRYLQSDRVHKLNHKGKHFTVEGPLNATRSKQGRPVLFHAGQSEAGRDLAARSADCVFAIASSKESAIEFYREMKERAKSHGRSPDDLRIIPGLVAYVGQTQEEADALYDSLYGMIPPEMGVNYLSKLLKMDLSAYSIDDPLPPIVGESVGVNAFRQTLGDVATRNKLTIRQTYERAMPALGQCFVKGTGTVVADYMEDWLHDKACDGFMVGAPIFPGGLESFVELVVPELQKRGLLRRSYTSSTLRENMRLPIPPNQFF